MWKHQLYDFVRCHEIVGAYSGKTNRVVSIEWTIERLPYAKLTKRILRCGKNWIHAAISGIDGKFWQKYEWYVWFDYKLQWCNRWSLGMDT